MLCALFLMDVHMRIAQDLDAAVDRYAGHTDPDDEIGPIRSVKNTTIPAMIIPPFETKSFKLNVVAARKLTSLFCKRLQVKAPEVHRTGNQRHHHHDAADRIRISMIGWHRESHRLRTQAA